VTFKSQVEIDAFSGNRSLQRIKRGAYLFIRWALLIIRLDLGPYDFARFVDYVNRRMRNAIDLLTFVSGITQTISVDNFVFWIEEQRKVDFTFPVGRDFLGETLANIRRVDADGEQFRILILL